MRLLLITALSFFSLNTFSQSFLPFHKDRAAYYQFNSSQIFYQQAGVSIDSFHVNGSDTIFYHYPIIDWDNGNGCYLKAHDTSFVGFQSIRTANGNDKFFNRSGDTILFKNDAVPTESWEMLQLVSGNKIVATVQSIDVESVLGIDDSVKTISLQAVDDLGNSIANIFNNKIFKIGKSLGLISGYSLFHFPDDAIAFSILGIENPTHGLSSENLTPEKIFDFEAGDRFDYDGGWNTEPTYHNHYCLTKVITAKQISSDGDSLIYTTDIKTHSGGNNWSEYYEGSLAYQTTEVYVLSTLNYMISKPFQWSPLFSEEEGGTSWLVSSIYNPGKTVKNNFHNYFNFDDTCLTEIIWGTGPGNIQYAEGLGKVYSYYGWSSQNNYESLIYFKKNGIEWGDSITCIPLGIEESDINAVNFFPNPVHDQLFLTGNFSAFKIDFFLLNSLGGKMKLPSTSINAGSVSLDVHDLPSGFYVLQLRNGDEVQNLKFVKN